MSDQGNLILWIMGRKYNRARALLIDPTDLTKAIKTIVQINEKIKEIEDKEIIPITTATIKQYEPLLKNCTLLTNKGEQKEIKDEILKKLIQSLNLKDSTHTSCLTVAIKAWDQWSKAIQTIGQSLSDKEFDALIVQTTNHLKYSYQQEISNENKDFSTFFTEEETAAEYVTDTFKDNPIYRSIQLQWATIEGMAQQKFINNAVQEFSRAVKGIEQEEIKVRELKIYCKQLQNVLKRSMPSTMQIRRRFKKTFFLQSIITQPFKRL